MSTKTSNTIRPAADSNAKRAHAAWFAMREHRKRRKERTPYDIERDAAVTDLLADLRHLCERDGIDFDACVRMSADHYEAEIGPTPDL